MKHLTWYDKLTGWLTGLWMGWIEYNHGVQETIFKYLDALIMTAFCGVIAGIVAYLTRKFCVKYFGEFFKVNDK